MIIVVVVVVVVVLWFCGGCYCFVLFRPLSEKKQVAGSTICTWSRETRRKKPTLEKSWLKHMLMKKRRCCFKHSVQKKLKSYKSMTFEIILFEDNAFKL